MPISPSNAVTNQLTDLVMLRFLVNAPYLTVGSKKYFSDQLVGKRNGVKYQFVVRDAGKVYNSLAHTDDGTAAGNVEAKNTVIEKAVEMQLEPWHIMVSTGAVEAVTDLRWDDEVAKPNGAKLANGVIRNTVKKNFPAAATAVFGEGFQPLAEAGAALEEISSEKVFGFVDAKYQAILTANGQQFQPVGSPDKFYANGLLGTFHNVEYRAQRFLPKIKMDASVKTAIEGASEASIETCDVTRSNCKYMLQLTVASGQYAVKAGTPIAVDGLFACDLIGDVTNSPFYFIVGEDVPAAGSASTTLKLPIGNVFYSSVAESGTRIFAKEDGSGFTGDINAAYSTAGSVNALLYSKTSGHKVSIPLEADATYFCGQLRLDGAMEFETLNKLDASNADTKVGNVEGFTMFENRVVDLDLMTNDTRWDVITLAGIIDPRAVINVYTKA